MANNANHLESERGIYLLGQIRQWLDKQNPTQLIDEKQRYNFILAEKLRVYIKEPGWIEENQVASALAFCAGTVDEALKPIVNELENSNHQLKVKNDLERKIYEYRLKEARPSFWDRSERVYQAKAEVLFALKCYLYSESSLVKLQASMEKNKAYYNQGWYSTLDDLIIQVKALKRQRLFDLSQLQTPRYPADKVMLKAISQFAKGEISQVYLVGTIDAVDAYQLSKGVQRLYQEALNIDEKSQAGCENLPEQQGVLASFF